MSDRFNVGLGAALGSAAGFLGGAAVYGHRNRAVQANAAFWGMALGGVFGAVIGAPSAEALKNRCVAGTLSGGSLSDPRFP